MTDYNFCKLLGLLFRYHSVPDLGKNNKFEKDTRYKIGSEANVEALAKNAEGTEIHYGDFLHPEKIQASELLRNPYVTDELRTNNGWNAFGRAYRLGETTDVSGLAEYSDRVPLLKELFE